jgi:hypothetical protein
MEARLELFPQEVSLTEHAFSEQFTRNGGLEGAQYD